MPDKSQDKELEKYGSDHQENKPGEEIEGVKSFVFHVFYLLSVDFEVIEYGFVFILGSQTGVY